MSGPPETSVDSFPRNGLLCPDCREPQYETPSGATCLSGDHGGADGVEPTPEEARKWGLSYGGFTLVTDITRTLDEGDEVSWTAGKETFCPVRFHAFDVGPVTVTTCVRPGEAPAETVARAKAFARAAWDVEYREKLSAHLERIREAAETARAR